MLMSLTPEYRKGKCNGIVFNNSLTTFDFAERPCKRKGTIEINGDLFCWQHARLEEKP